MIGVLTVTGVIAGFFAWTITLGVLIAKGMEHPARPVLLWSAAALFIVGVFLAVLLTAAASGAL